MKALLLRVADILIQSKGVFFSLTYVLLFHVETRMALEISRQTSGYIQACLALKDQKNHITEQFYSLFPGSVQVFTVRGTVPPMTFMLLQKIHPC